MPRQISPSEGAAMMPIDAIPRLTIARLTVYSVRPSRNSRVPSSGSTSAKHCREMSRGGGNMAGNGFLIPANGLLNGPGGSTSVCCGLNGVICAKRVLKNALWRVSQKMPDPPRRLVLPLPNKS